EPGGTDRNRSDAQQQRKECRMPFGRLFAGRWRPGKLRRESSARRGRVQRKKGGPLGRLQDSPTGKVLPLPVEPVYPRFGLFRGSRSGAMSEPSVQRAQLQDWFQRIKAGDRTARDEMFRALSGRLEYLARTMLRRFPNVRRYADTEDILQSSLVRLLRTLEKVQPTTMRHLVNLAGVQIRRELIDLARYLSSRPRFVNSGQEQETDAVPAEPAEVSEPPEDLERWTAFHRRVESLSAAEREVVSLIYYHGWSHAEVAELFHVSERTVRRRWDAARAKLHGLLRDEQPGA